MSVHLKWTLPRMTNQSASSSDQRTVLAPSSAEVSVFTTRLALDRTTLAWIRTTLTMASFGFGVVAFFRSLRQSFPSPENVRMHQGAALFGTGLVVLGTLFTLFAALSHWSALRQLRRGRTPRISLWPLSLSLAISCRVTSHINQDVERGRADFCGIDPLPRPLQIALGP